MARLATDIQPAVDTSVTSFGKVYVAGYSRSIQVEKAILPPGFNIRTVSE